MATHYAGGITLTCFLAQVATGFALTFYYLLVTKALTFVQCIATEAKWLASIIVLMMILHV